MSCLDALINVSNLTVLTLCSSALRRVSGKARAKSVAGNAALCQLRNLRELPTSDQYKPDEEPSESEEDGPDSEEDELEEELSEGEESDKDQSEQDELRGNGVKGKSLKV